MRIGRALAAVVVVAMFGAFLSIAKASGNATGTLKPGDVLTYDLSIEFQVHVSPAPHTTQPPITVESAAKGTETITALSEDADGSINTSVAIALNASGSGGSRSLQHVLLVKVKPDGSMEPQAGADPMTETYLKAIGDAAQMYRGRKLYVGETVDQTVTIPGAFPIKVTTKAKVVNQSDYRGYPTFAIQSTGTGKIDDEISGVRATGTFQVAGTTYVDQRDQLLVGSAVRSDVNALVAGAQGNRVTAVATVDLLLDSYKHHAVKTPPKAAPPTAAPSPTPVASASPAAPPSATPASEYYTPTPPAPTPSPVVTGYTPPPSG